MGRRKRSESEQLKLSPPMTLSSLYHIKSYGPPLFITPMTAGYIWCVWRIFICIHAIRANQIKVLSIHATSSTLLPISPSGEALTELGAEFAAMPCPYRKSGWSVRPLTDNFPAPLYANGNQGSRIWPVWFIIAAPSCNRCKFLLSVLSNCPYIMNLRSDRKMLVIWPMLLNLPTEQKFHIKWKG